MHKTNSLKWLIGGSVIAGFLLTFAAFFAMKFPDQNDIISPRPFRQEYVEGRVAAPFFSPLSSDLRDKGSINTSARKSETIIPTARTSRLSEVSTSLSPSDCKPMSAQLLRLYEASGLSGQECPALDDYRVLFVSSDSNSWIDLAIADNIFSLEHEVVKSEFGQFANVDAGFPLVWAVDRQNLPRAIVVKISAIPYPDERTRPETYATANPVRFFVILINQGRACHHAATRTFEAAWQMLETDQECKQELPQRPEREAL